MAAKARKTCSIRDLAKHLGLSTCAVSKILSGDESFGASEETRRRVLAAAKRLDYVPNVNARRLFKRKSNVVGLLVPTQEELGLNAFSDRHVGDMMSGMERELLKTPYDLLVLFNQNPSSRTRRYESLFRSGLIDGLLIWGVRSSDSYWNELQELSGPRIFLANVPDSSSSGRALNFITSDYERTAFEIVKRLHSSGARRFFWLAGKRDSSVASMIEAGIIKASQELGFAFGPSDIAYGDYEAESSFELASKALAEKRCDAFLATSPGNASGAAKAVAASSSSALVGCFDGNRSLEMAGLRHSWLSAFPDDVKIGELAVLSLLKLIDSPRSKEPVQIKVPALFELPERFK